ncbi:MAG: hypothetical protein HW416_1485 [Chloroflexi bacterium]|nr:hypothetical protein [Chloroflexota bacterium]
MAHDVFISYANQDKPIADAVCARLEGKGIRCWIAPRDVLAGTEWSESIVDGINESRLLVLIYSGNSNDSPQVRREIERAVTKGIALLPFRIEDVPLSKSLEYFISTPHWLDALSQPVEAHIEHLADTCGILLARLDSGVGAHSTPPETSRDNESPATSAVPGGGASPERSPTSVPLTAGAGHLATGRPPGLSRSLPAISRRLLIGGVGAIAVLLLGAGLLLSGRFSLAGLVADGASNSDEVSTPWCPSRISFGEAISCSIEQPTDVSTFAFSANGGDRIRVRLVESGSSLVAAIELVGPGGLRVCEAPTAGELDCQISQSGLHAVRVFDSRKSGTGDYYLHLQRLNDPAGCKRLTITGDTQRGSIDSFVQTHCYTVSGAAGDQARMGMIRTAGDFSPAMDVLTASGTRACGSSVGPEATCEWIESGVYSVLVGDGPNPRPRLGRYELSLVCTKTGGVCGGASGPAR